MGVWIETLMQEKLIGKIASHPSWVCGLKLFIRTGTRKVKQVTPFVGVWIETYIYRLRTERYNKSHPSWVCGLKQKEMSLRKTNFKSHPSWVCGLKQNLLQKQICALLSHPSWVCGLKHILESH